MLLRQESLDSGGSKETKIVFKILLEIRRHCTKTCAVSPVRLAALPAAPPARRVQKIADIAPSFRRFRLRQLFCDALMLYKQKAENGKLWR